MKKVERELICHGEIIQPCLSGRCYNSEGPGAKTLNNIDFFVLLYLHLEEPSWSLPSHKENLFLMAGTTIHESTLCRFWLNAFPTKGGFFRPNSIPIKKFKPENVIRAKEFVSILSKICPLKLKYGDEKLLKGTEVYCRKNRRNVLTGEVPVTITGSDF